MYEDIDSRPAASLAKKMIVATSAEDSSVAGISADRPQPTEVIPEYEQRRPLRANDPDPEPSAPKANVVHGEFKPSPDAQIVDTTEIDDAECENAAEAGGGIMAFATYAVWILFLLWMATLSAPFMANALTLQGWRFWCSMVLGSLPLVIALGIGIYAVIRLRKMPKVAQFVESEYELRFKSLKAELRTRYLDKLPDADKYASENRFSAKVCPQLINCLQKLREKVPTTYSDSSGWFDDFKRFQEMQDERAKEIIGRTWKLVAIKTAASPWKIVDMIAVVYNSTVMVMRLARLYNRRTSRGAAFRLVCRWFVSVYIAGEMGDVTQGAVEWASASDLISSTYKPLAGFAGKIAEGGANAFMVYRLGRRAMAYFRPLVGTRKL